MKIRDINIKAQKLNSIKDSSKIFEELRNLPTNILKDLETSFYPTDLFRPVVFLRFLILQKVKNREEVTAQTLEDFKKAIENRNVSAYYKTTPEFQRSLEGYKDADRGMYPQWKEPFSILYPFFYSGQEKLEILSELERLGNEVISKYGIKNAKVHTVGFDGPQNYGSDRAWVAIIPEVSSNVQRAYQLFFGINHNGINGGLYKGHKVENDSFENISMSYQTWDDFLIDIEKHIPEWEKLNSTIDFHFQNDERDFKNRIDKLNKEEVLVYLKYLDEIFAELSVINEDNLVFSTASNQLSFQIGNRYCLNLKKDTYSFIAPINHHIDGIEKETFRGGADALLYKDTSRQLVSSNISAIKTAIQFELDRNRNNKTKEHDNAAFRRVVFDSEYRLNFFDSSRSDLDVANSVLLNNDQLLINMSNEIKLNQIFFGPPGTGKTFHTIEEAVRIINPEYYEKYKFDRDKLRKEYNDKLIVDWESTKGQIGFCTFHQSFSYEDFVEGIKPLEPQDGDTFLKYKIQEGIFKKICALAEASIKSLSRPEGRLVSLSDTEFSHSVFYKLSLGDINDPADQEIYDYSIEKGVISLGFGDGVDFTGKDESGVIELYSKRLKEGYGATAMNLFKNYLKVGNYVIISKGNHYIRALGKVVGEYFYDPNTPIRHKHFRKVEWIFVNQDIPVQELYEKNLSQQTIYKLKKDFIKRDFFAVTKDNVDSSSSKIPKNFVLIIDEINRGNVSSVFGELITLIEEDKRAGKKESLELVLPYSKQTFSVPYNLYIIATMNTADRSVEALDSALRRRFSFREMVPNSAIINPRVSAGIDLQQLLIKINERLEILLSKEHTIGHAYLLGIKNVSDLKHAFENKIIPLLKEYFYGDFGKISMVIGNDFVYQESNSNTRFLGTYHDMMDQYAEVKPWFFTDIKNMGDSKFIESIKKVYS